MTLQINHMWMVLNKQQPWVLTCILVKLTKWVMIIKMKPNSNSQDQNMQFPIIYI